MRAISFLLFCGLFLSQSLIAQVTVAGKLLDTDGKPFDGKVTISISCGTPSIRSIGDFKKGDYSIYLNTVTPSCHCKIMATPENTSFTSMSLNIFIPADFKNRQFNQDLILESKFSPAKEYEKKIAELKREKEQIFNDLAMLEKQLNYSQGENRELRTKVAKLELDRANLEAILKQAEMTLDDIKEGTVPIAHYIGEINKLTTDFARVQANLNERIASIEREYEDVLIANTFGSDCKCIGKTKSSITLSLRLKRNEVKDKKDRAILEGNTPLHRKAKVHIRVKALKDENDMNGFVTIQAKGELDFIEVVAFFDEHPIEVVFHSSGDAFHDRFLQNKPGRMVEILTETGMISSYLYLPKLSEVCNDTTRLPSLDMPIRP